MLILPLEQLKERIKASAGISDEELDLRIKKKLDELAGLISAEGAAHIVANEMGVQMTAPMAAALKVKDLGAGMRNVELLGKVMRLFEVRNFQTERGAGKVGSFVLGDETGTARIVLWHTQADLLGQLKEGDIVKVKSGYVRTNALGLEVHMNERSALQVNPPGETVNVTAEKVPSAVRKSLTELQENDQNVEIFVTLVDVYEPRYFTVCPNCGKRAFEKEGMINCAQHGAVQPKLSYVLNVLGDDGTTTIRITLWRNQAERLLGLDEAAMLRYKDYPEEFQDVKHKLLGEMVKFVGRVNKNTMFERLEFNAQLVFLNPNPEEELKRLEQQAA